MLKESLALEGYTSRKQKKNKITFCFSQKLKKYIHLLTVHGVVWTFCKSLTLKMAISSD